MYHHYRNQQSGITLIEVLIAMVIIAVSLIAGGVAMLESIRLCRQALFVSQQAEPVASILAQFQ